MILTIAVHRLNFVGPQGRHGCRVSSPQPFCTEPLCEQPRVVRRTPSDLFRIFVLRTSLACARSGWLESRTSRQRQSGRLPQTKKANHEAPAKNKSKRMPGRPPQQHLPKRLSLLLPQPHRAWDVRRLSDSTRKRRRRSQNKGPRKSRPSKSHGGGQHGRPQKKPLQQLAQRGKQRGKH